MNQRFTYSEQVDLYLKGKLSESERIAFDEQMRRDPLLQNEITLQQEVYKAIGQARRSGIKARLNQISVEQSPWFVGSTFRVAAVISAILITSVGAYLSYNYSNDETIITQVDITSARKGPSIIQKEHLSKPSVTTSNEVISAPNESTFVADTRPAAYEPVRKSPVIQRPKVATEFSEDAVQLDYSDFDMPQKQALQAKDLAESNISIQRIADKTYPFHYQLYDDKLFLHGDFTDEPYKIIALNTADNRSLFLEYNENYYILEEHQEISPLVLIQDTVLITELRRLSITN